MRSLLVSPEALAGRGPQIAGSPDLAALRARLAGELGEFVARPL